METSQKGNLRNYYPFILIFVALKAALNLVAAPHFGFHRDELLHLALGDHLTWGYKEVPPFIGLLAYLATHVFGNSVAAARIFPTVAAGLLVWFTGLLTAELKGSRFAIALACLSTIFAPAFAASDYLFQPVVFDQLWWLIAAWLVVKYINTRQNGCLYWLGAITGIGMLTKYTMAFFAIALLLGVLLTPQRKLLWNKAVLVMLLMTTIIFMPNIVWQYQHHWPFITHMHKLKQLQLSYLNPADFIKEQLLVNGLFGVLWLTGFVALLLDKRLKEYRFMAFAYLLVFIFLLKMNGKGYYLFGAYPMLFAAGGYAIERLTARRRYALRMAVTAAMLLPSLLFLPVVLPVLPMRSTIVFFKFVHRHVPVLNMFTTWEDRKVHAITQDYADMLGWEEMTRLVAGTYRQLPRSEQAQTIIFTDNYGEAAALHHYHVQYGLPDVTSLNSSFALWAPPHIHAAQVIYVSDDADISDLIPLAESYKNAGSIQNPLAREHGTAVFLITHPKSVLNTVYHQHWAVEQRQ